MARLSNSDHSGAGPATESLNALLTRIGACRFCVETPVGAPLPHEPSPVLRVSATARLLIAGQAPGLRAHQSGLPFDDPSGDRLREWMGVDKSTFYDQACVAFIPMGFCFPGYNAKKSDLPPRRECRAVWHDALLALMPQIETILVVGSYARDYHFARLGVAVSRGESLTSVVRRWRDFQCARPKIVPLPHPSWRNSGWLKANPWFAAELLPVLRREVGDAIAPR